MMFRLWDKAGKCWMPGVEGEDYNFDIYGDGSFSVSTNKMIDGKMRCVSLKSEHYELYMKVECLEWAKERK